MGSKKDERKADLLSEIVRLARSGPRREASEAAEVAPAASASHVEKVIFELQAELERVQIRLADFEHKHRMSFEEFQANLSPGSPPEIQQDCLEWSRWAEKRRELASDLERASRLKERLRAVPPGGETAAAGAAPLAQPGRESQSLPIPSRWPTRVSLHKTAADAIDWLRRVQPSRRSTKRSRQ